MQTYRMLFDSIWRPIVASGGSVYDVTKSGVTYRIHRFYSNSTFIVTDSGTDGLVSGFLCGGGGSGASSTQRVAFAGSGAGGRIRLVENKPVVVSSTYYVTVGAGGAATTGSNANGNSGGSTSCTNLHNEFYIEGSNPGLIASSGGNSYPLNAPAGSWGVPSGGNYYLGIPYGPGYEYNAGKSYASTTAPATGGGAGAGGDGRDASNNTGYGGMGADGATPSSIHPDSSIGTFGGGGGGWGYYGGGPGYDGGANGPASNNYGIDAVANRGGGGSGGNGYGGAGGSGRLDIWYPITKP